jgi:hypothetical protein
MATVDSWGSDVRISQPKPIDTDYPAHVDLGGFSFGPNGIMHDINSQQIEEVFTPTYSPLPRGKDS